MPYSSQYLEILQTVGLFFEWSFPNTHTMNTPVILVCSTSCFCRNELFPQIDSRCYLQIRPAGKKKRKKEKKKRIRANEKFQDVAWISTRWTKNNAEKAARVELLIYTRTWPAWMDPSSCNWCHVQPKCCLHALPSNAIRFSLRV